jgi:hypothetical protein
MNIKHNWTPDEFKFLQENYPILGKEKCAKLLNLTLEQIHSKVTKSKIKLTTSTRTLLSKNSWIIRSNTKTSKDYHVNPDQFINISTPEVSYILGLLWADGYVVSKNHTQRISIECQRDDLEKLAFIFTKTGTWAMRFRKRKNRKEQMQIDTNNKKLVEFLITNDYHVKSGNSADKILSNIPDNLKHFWFRGLIDGDGCFYINDKNYCTQFSVAGPYEQDWSYIENILKSMNINYGISRRKQLQHGKINKSSVIRLTNKTDIVKFGKYIYQNYEIDKIGLNRKYEKFQNILNNYSMSLP